MARTAGVTDLAAPSVAVARLPRLRFWPAVGAVAVLGLAIRLALLLSFADEPGDGPGRATNGYHWFLTHHISFYGNWPPGHEVLVGLVLYLVPDPALAARLLSLAAGALGIPLLAWLARRLFGASAALLAATALTLNPLHAALSATSLSDAVALAALLALLVATVRLGDTPNRAGLWLAVGVASLIGSSVRLEFWLALPIIVLHHLARTRSLWRAALLALVTGIFPLIWLAERLRIGGLVATYETSVAGARLVGGEPVDLASGAFTLGSTLATLLGGPLLWLAVLALLALAAGVGRPARRADLAAMLALLAAETLFLVKLAADRGTALLPRYLLTEAALLLPLAAFALITCLRPRPVAGAATLLAAAAMLHAAWSSGLDLDLVRQIPASTRAAASWVEQRPPDEPMLMTRMGWQSSYIPVLARLAPDRYRIVSDWLPDQGLRDFVRDRRPAYVITRDTDGDLLRHLCLVTGLNAQTSRIIAQFGRLAVLPLEPGNCDGPR